MTKKSDTDNTKDAHINFHEEAKQHWGDTKEYIQSIKRTSKYTNEDWDEIIADKDKIFKAFAQTMDKDDAENEIELLVIQWKEHITKYYYECSDDMLADLADMYLSDIRLKENIDEYKEGLAEFIGDAMKDYYIKVHP